MEDYHVEPIKIYENTYHLGPREGEKFVQSKVTTVLQEILKNKLADKTYSPELSVKVSKELCSEIQERLRGMGFPRYKFITQVIIQEAKGQSSRVASRCLWDVEHDNFAEATYKNPTMIAVAIVFACYYE